MTGEIMELIRPALEPSFSSKNAWNLVIKEDTVHGAIVSVLPPVDELKVKCSP